MGKRRSWVYAVKKALICESKQNKEKKKSQSGRCFGKQKSINLDSSNAEKALVVLPSAHSPVEDVKLIEAESEQNRHAYSVALATAMAAEAAVAAANAAAEVVRLRAAACMPKEDIAAIKIQTAFRGYLARRALRALRGLMRLKSVIGGKSVKRQAASTLKSMQTLAHLQSEIRARRIRTTEMNSAVQRQIEQKHEKDLHRSRAYVGENWDESRQSKEQIEANIQNRQEAAARRERALAYAYSHQQAIRNTQNATNQTFMDPNNPHWGWSWLERWMAARPWENGSAAIREPNGGLVSISNRSVQSPTAGKPAGRPSRQSPSTPKSKDVGKIRPVSSRGTIGTDEDSKSMNSIQSERCRRQSICSWVRDDDSLASSPAVPGYMASTESARSKSRLPSPQGPDKIGTPDRVSVGSAKKRLSFSGSPARPRRHSGPTKSDATS